MSIVTQLQHGEGLLQEAVCKQQLKNNHWLGKHLAWSVWQALSKEYLSAGSGWCADILGSVLKVLAS